MRYVLRKIEERWAICIDGSAALKCDDLEEAFMLAWTAASIMQTATGSCDGRSGEPLGALDSVGSR